MLGANEKRIYEENVIPFTLKKRRPKAKKRHLMKKQTINQNEKKQTTNKKKTKANRATKKIIPPNLSSTSFQV